MIFSSHSSLGFHPMACFSLEVGYSRLLKWGVVSYNVCVLCHLEGETHDHFFFECIVSGAGWILKHLFSKCGIIRNSRGLSEEVTSAVNHVRGTYFADTTFFVQ